MATYSSGCSICGNPAQLSGADGLLYDGLGKHIHQPQIRDEVERIVVESEAANEREAKLRALSHPPSPRPETAEQG